MSKVKFFALGGIGEIGKNMYVLEIADDIFVLDCGSASPTAELYGYDSIIPDFAYLKENSSRIKGIFLSHFMQKATGGFPRVLKDLKAPYYGSKYTIEAIKKRYIPFIEEEDKDGIEFVSVSENETIDINGTQISFFIVSNSMPDSFGISFKINIREEGEEPEYKNIVYLPDFNFDMNLKGHFRTDFKAITRIADEGVMMLLCPSTGAPKIGHITTDGKLDIALHKVLAHEGRCYILMDAENVGGIVQVLDAVDFQKRKVTIIGSKARSLVEIAMEMGYCPKYENSYLKKSVLNDDYRNDDKTVVIIAGEQTEEFYALQRIATYQDPHYTLKPTDNVIFLVDTPKKFEKVLAVTWDNIWINNANLIEFDTKLMPSSILGAEDTKLLYSLLSPDYIVPVSGDYRMLKSQYELALDYGYDPEKVIKLENGTVINFQNGKYIKEENDYFETGDILFGLESDRDINDYVARERESLTQEGFIVMSGLISLREREIVGDVEIVSYGFLPEYGQEDAVKLIKAKFKEIVNIHLRMKKVDYKELRLDLKNEISKVIVKETKKKPTLIPVIIDISSI